MFKPEDLASQPVEARRVMTAERHMTITPLDLRQARFSTSMRGYDRNEVVAYLEEAAEGYDHALRENERLRMEIVRLEAMLTQFRDLEGSLKNTLMSAQKVADDMRENASQESERIVREAEGRAKLLMQTTQGQLEDVRRDIDGLKMKRREAEASVEATITSLHHTLDFIREQREREERVVQHRPRVDSIAANA
jgi:cell division initiation protein